MCLITNNIEPTVLKEPLTAYKIVAIHKLSPRSKKVTINSIYYKQEWKLGRVYFLPVSSIISHITPRPHFLQENITHYEINVGFHLYTKDPEQHLDNYQTDPFMEAAGMDPFAILEGTVPAGSNIWGDDEIVSDCFVPNRCYAFIARKPFLGIKRKPKQIYYKTE